ncbi:cell division protein FtsQ/DivIB [Asticcacaulis sp. AC402]|uniref:cell division protein FtsQ/DivIB n=1 Tax=Asticcacaulis sp. AC402 TaxID=1282361 RepID=UPI0003C3BD2E|nr:cell division protein FtsQ/DivIB [Asticcacaulis sp. AC402]ESQ75550.1 cell division protein FtsQ [Asticcacaulis sp. AC402]
MPAVVRGGRRQASAPAPAQGKAQGKGSAKPAGKRPAGRKAAGPAGKSSVIGSVAVPNELRAWFAVVIVVVLLGVVLFTGQRAQALGGAVTGFADSRLAAMGLKLQNIRLVGVSDEAEPAIKRALKKTLTAGQPIALLDLKKLQAEIEAVGWVKEASVRRQLPGLLVVSIVERPRLAVWQYRGRDTVIDDQGHIIPEAQASRFLDLPLVVGEGANETANDILQLMQTRPALMQKTYALVRVDTRRWDVHLKNGAIIKLPALNQEQALNTLDTLMVRQRVLDQGFAEIDLLDPEALVVVPIEAHPNL